MNAGAWLDVGGTSTSTFYTFLNGLRSSGRDISVYHNVTNSPLTFHTSLGLHQITIFHLTQEQPRD